MDRIGSPDRNVGVIELLIVAVIVTVLTQTSYFIEHDRYATNIAELKDEGFNASRQIDLWISASANARSVLMEAQHCRGGDRFRWRSGGAHTVERLKRADRTC